MAAIFDFRHTRTSDSVLTSISGLPDPENMDIAVEFLLLSYIETEIYIIFCALPVLAVIFDFRLTQTSDSLPISFSGLPDSENMGIAVEI